MQKITNRSLHRDLAYFYVGLIIAFSFSGIILNHRANWYPEQYTYEIKEVNIDFPSDINDISEEFVVKLSNGWDLQYDGHRIKDNELRAYFKDNVVLDADVKTGKGNLEYKRKVPFVGHTMFLHKARSNYWIWYSDIFGVAMIVIAVTGMLIPVGKDGFNKRGWKLMLIGLIFPLIFLFLIS